MLAWTATRLSLRVGDSRQTGGEEGPQPLEHDGRNLMLPLKLIPVDGQAGRTQGVAQLDGYRERQNRVVSTMRLEHGQRLLRGHERAPARCGNQRGGEQHQPGERTT